MRTRCLLLLAAGLGAAACSDDGGSPDAAIDSGVRREASVGSYDSLPPTPSVDAGPGAACASLCDCPQGLACIDSICRAVGLAPVLCCENTPCPEGMPCVDRSNMPSECPEAVDAGPDAGFLPSVGDGCDSDEDCMGGETELSCWRENAPPFLWGGYCTVDACEPQCPGGSSCINFVGSQAPILGCMKDCVTDDDCREDAYCLTVPNASVRVCFPDCRDDLIDCAPRDGSRFCSRTTGRCEITPTQSMSVAVGASCMDGSECGTGQVCMGEEIWQFPGGICTKVCGGLPEASACESGELCLPFAGIELCFQPCESGACPLRSEAICDVLDAAWPEPACVSL